MSHGKRYLDAVKEFDSQKPYAPAEAIALIKKLAKAKFDETIDVHMRLGIDPRQAEQQIRRSIVLPAGTGKTVRIAVFAEGEDARIATEAGADIVGGDELIDRVQKESFFEFDVAIATPNMMGKVSRIGRMLGPRGLMPNPKSGTVVPGTDMPRVISESRAGRVEYRNDRTGNLHVPIGKASFTEAQLMQNLAALMEDVRRAKPSSVKGIYIRKLTITPTMGPSVRIDPNAAINLDS